MKTSDKMDQTPQFEDRIVAFVDILGFGTLVSSLSTNPELHARLHYALTYIKSHRESSHAAHSHREVSVFSDSIVISAEIFDAFEVIWTCGWLHAQLLYSGVLTRGGISIGPTIHKDDVLYGEGMLKAYRIESSAAVYPRIVIDPELLRRLAPGTKKKLLDQDSDGLWFIDPFKFDAMPGGAEELASDGYDPRAIYFEELRKHITAAIEGAKQVDHFAKWNWLANRYSIAFELYSESQKAKRGTVQKTAEQNAPADAEKRRR